MEQLSVPGIILGAMDPVDLPEATIDVAPGDLLVFYTDGVTEATDKWGEMFGEQCLAHTVAAAASDGAGASGVIDAVVQAVHAYSAGCPQADDLTVVAIKRDANSGVGYSGWAPVPTT